MKKTIAVILTAMVLTACSKGSTNPTTQMYTGSIPNGSTNFTVPNLTLGPNDAFYPSINGRALVSCQPSQVALEVCFMENADGSLTLHTLNFSPASYEVTVNRH